MAPAVARPDDRPSLRRVPDPLRGRVLPRPVPAAAAGHPGRRPARPVGRHRAVHAPGAPPAPHPPSAVRRHLARVAHDRPGAHGDHRDRHPALARRRRRAAPLPGVDRQLVRVHRPRHHGPGHRPDRPRRLSGGHHVLDRRLAAVAGAAGRGLDRPPCPRARLAGPPGAGRAGSGVLLVRLRQAARGRTELGRRLDAAGLPDRSATGALPARRPRPERRLVPRLGRPRELLVQQRPTP